MFLGDRITEVMILRTFAIQILWVESIAVAILDY